jgi:hypothetical protein
MANVIVIYDYFGMGRSLTDIPESLTSGSYFKIECHRVQSGSHGTVLGGH